MNFHILYLSTCQTTVQCFFKLCIIVIDCILSPKLCLASFISLSCLVFSFRVMIVWAQKTSYEWLLLLREICECNKVYKLYPISWNCCEGTMSNLCNKKACYALPHFPSHPLSPLFISYFSMDYCAFSTILLIFQGISYKLFL